MVPYWPIFYLVNTLFECHSLFSWPSVCYHSRQPVLLEMKAQRKLAKKIGREERKTKKPGYSLFKILFFSDMEKQDADSLEKRLAFLFLSFFYYLCRFKGGMEMAES